MPDELETLFGQVRLSETNQAEVRDIVSADKIDAARVRRLLNLTKKLGERTILESFFTRLTARRRVQSLRRRRRRPPQTKRRRGR